MTYTKRPVNKAWNRPSPLRWLSGPPPSLGWWIASTNEDPTMLRWWNGQVWSQPVVKTRDALHAGEAAKHPTQAASAVKYLPRPDDWPERSKT